MERGGRLILRTQARWAAQRRRVYERDGARCQGCGLTVGDAFHVDHIRGRGMGGGFRDDGMENLRLLCVGCHMARHGQRLG